ncbi:hypothetical protein L6452_03859 [Arctium lappa]|uniref:Uncharacterized protein n=1 Tax=Arctium lappa TaxID=4217 RepID=A0ACB9FPE1_ARCLA|nr:hypothetical protein L6452_03859 [Arctium lappa]
MKKKKQPAGLSPSRSPSSSILTLWNEALSAGLLGFFVHMKKKKQPVRLSPSRSPSSSILTPWNEAQSTGLLFFFSHEDEEATILKTPISITNFGTEDCLNLTLRGFEGW